MINVQSKLFYLNDKQKAWVQKMLHSMSTEEKVGQLFCVMGQDYTPEQLQSMAADGKIGGILFRPEPAQRIRMRYAPLDEAARIPLLKAANLEEAEPAGFQTAHCSAGRCCPPPQMMKASWKNSGSSAPLRAAAPASTGRSARYAIST